MKTMIKNGIMGCYRNVPYCTVLWKRATHVTCQHSLRLCILDYGMHIRLKMWSLYLSVHEQVCLCGW